MSTGLNKRLKWLEENVEPPKRFRNYQKISFEEFKKKVESYDEELTNSIYAGDAYIITGVIEPKILEKMKQDAIIWSKDKESSYEPMIEGAKDFHQIIKEGTSMKYKIQPVRHSYFFFRWNDDPLNLFSHADKIWSLVKTFGGFGPDAYVNNKPKDGVVDRAQLAHYPPGAGLIPKHIDPHHNQKMILGVYLSKYGEDFSQGGIYFVDKEDKEILLEPEINRGDAVVAYSTVVHGVSLIDPDAQNSDWNSDKGRWFLGLYSNDSNEKKERITSYTVS